MNKVRKGLIFILVSPSGGGKTTIANKLIKNHSKSLNFVVTYTTRKQRENEVDGKHYHFITEDEFLKKIDANELFEYEKIHGNYYGNSKKKLETLLEKGVDVIYTVDIKGALKFKEEYSSETCVVFLALPSKEEMLTRLKRRGDSSSDIERRLKTANSEHAKLLELHGTGKIDYFVVNDKLEESVELVDAILRAERSKTARLTKETIVNKLKA